MPVLKNAKNMLIWVWIIAGSVLKNAVHAQLPASKWQQRFKVFGLSRKIMHHGE
jgi:hypothetical protein